jgi:hypothetical protein
VGPTAGLDSFWDSNRDCSVLRAVVVARYGGVSMSVCDWIDLAQDRSRAEILWTRQ